MVFIPDQQIIRNTSVVIINNLTGGVKVMATESVKSQILGDFKTLQSECQSKVNRLSGRINIDYAG